MTPTWSFTARTFLDQLEPGERSRVVAAVERVAREWPDVPGDRLRRVVGAAGDLWMLRIGSDLRALFQTGGGQLHVVDVIRRGQIEGLRELAGAVGRDA